ncbi:MAG TPA: amino acid permease, partial [Candidatus Angelobacter sp.]|nr:amino acid permease [Candidatus Angelobacter sp.]
KAIHPRFRTPWISTLTVGLVVAVLAASLPIDQLGEMVNIGTMLAFAIVCGGVWVLRRSHPDLPRPFKTPWVPFVPIMGIIVSLYLMYNVQTNTKWRLIIWLVVGMFVYFGYSRSHSRVQRGEMA